MTRTKSVAMWAAITVLIGTTVCADSIPFEQEALGKSCVELTAQRSDLAKQVRLRRDRLPDFLLGDEWNTSREAFDGWQCFRSLSLRKLEFPRRGCVDEGRRDEGKAIADDLRSLMGDYFADLILGNIGQVLQGHRKIRTKRDAGRAIQDLLSLETFQGNLAVVSKVFRDKNCGADPNPIVTVEELSGSTP